MPTVRVTMAVKAGFGLNCTINPASQWSRRRERARDFVGEVDVAGGVDEVQLVGLALVAVFHPHRAGLDRDPALPLELHVVEHLLLELPLLHRAGELEEPVGQRALAVVDVGDDREVANTCEVHGGSLKATGQVGGEGGSLLALPSLIRDGAGSETSKRITVANIKSQKKRNLTNAKRAARNKAVKSELKTRVKNARTAAGTDQADEALRLAVKRLDVAASKGVIHPNQAARRKSRLMKQLNAG